MTFSDLSWKEQNALAKERQEQYTMMMTELQEEELYDALRTMTQKSLFQENQMWHLLCNPQLAYTFKCQMARYDYEEKRRAERIKALPLHKQAILWMKGRI
jgi:hypothetical protein